jgi:hypothetical protein
MKKFSNYKQEKLSTAACAAIKAVNGLTFTHGSIANTICEYKSNNPIEKVNENNFFLILITDLASGSSVDWAYDKANAKIAFALELRGKDGLGFVLPVNEIRPASLETWAGIKKTLDSI